MSISQNFPTISPSLSLNFARSKTLDPRITFIRTTAGTRTNETGLVEVVPANAPRFDHSYDPVSGSVMSLGLLVEEQRTNLVTHNATDFNYSINNQIIATALDTAPDGNIVLCKHDLTGATSPFLNCRANTTLSSGNTYTMSMWLKGTTNFSASFAFVGETISEIYSNIANVTTEWKRFTLTFTLTNTQTLSRLQVFFAQQGEGKVISIWGAQLELGSFATTYIPRPTAGQQATRTQDNPKIEGENFSSWYNQSEGTFLINGRTDNPSFQRSYGVSVFNIDEIPSLLNRLSIRMGNTFMNTGGTTQFGYYQSPTAGVPYKVSVAFKTNSALQVLNGVASGNEDTVVTPPTNLNIMEIGKVENNTSLYINGHIAQITYYPKRLTNTQLINLTK